MAGLGQKGNAAFGRQQVAHPPATTELRISSPKILLLRVQSGRATPTPATDTVSVVPSVCPLYAEEKGSQFSVS